MGPDNRGDETLTPRKISTYVNNTGEGSPWEFRTENGTRVNMLQYIGTEPMIRQRLDGGGVIADNAFFAEYYDIKQDYEGKTNIEDASIVAANNLWLPNIDLQAQSWKNGKSGYVDLASSDSNILTTSGLTPNAKKQKRHTVTQFGSGSGLSGTSYRDLTGSEAREDWASANYRRRKERNTHWISATDFGTDEEQRERAYHAYRLSNTSSSYHLSNGLSFYWEQTTRQLRRSNGEYLPTVTSQEVEDRVTIEDREYKFRQIMTGRTIAHTHVFGSFTVNETTETCAVPIDQVETAILRYDFLPLELKTNDELALWLTAHTAEVTQANNRRIHLHVTTDNDKIKMVSDASTQTESIYQVDVSHLPSMAVNQVKGGATHSIRMSPYLQLSSTPEGKLIVQQPGNFSESCTQTAGFPLVSGALPTSASQQYARIYGSELLAKSSLQCPYCSQMLGLQHMHIQNNGNISQIPAGRCCAFVCPNDTCPGLGNNIGHTGGDGAFMMSTRYATVALREYVSLIQLLLKSLGSGLNNGSEQNQTVIFLILSYLDNSPAVESELGNRPRIFSSMPFNEDLNGAPTRLLTAKMHIDFLYKSAMDFRAKLRDILEAHGVLETSSDIAKPPTWSNRKEGDAFITVDRTWCGILPGIYALSQNLFQDLEQNYNFNAYPPSEDEGEEEEPVLRKWGDWDDNTRCAEQNGRIRLSSLVSLWNLFPLKENLVDLVGAWTEVTTTSGTPSYQHQDISNESLKSHYDRLQKKFPHLSRREIEILDYGFRPHIIITTSSGVRNGNKGKSQVDIQAGIEETLFVNQVDDAHKLEPTQIKRGPGTNGTRDVYETHPRHFNPDKWGEFYPSLVVEWILKLPLILHGSSQWSQQLATKDDQWNRLNSHRRLGKTCVDVNYPCHLGDKTINRFFAQDQAWDLFMDPDQNSQTFLQLHEEARISPETIRWNYDCAFGNLTHNMDSFIESMMGVDRASIRKMTLHIDKYRTPTYYLDDLKHQVDTLEKKQFETDTKICEDDNFQERVITHKLNCSEPHLMNDGSHPYEHILLRARRKQVIDTHLATMVIRAAVAALIVTPVESRPTTLPVTVSGCLNNTTALMAIITIMVMVICLITGHVMASTRMENLTEMVLNCLSRQLSTDASRSYDHIRDRHSVTLHQTSQIQGCYAWRAISVMLTLSVIDLTQKLSELVRTTVTLFKAFKRFVLSIVVHPRTIITLLGVWAISCVIDNPTSGRSPVRIFENNSTFQDVTYGGNIQFTQVGDPNRTHFLLRDNENQLLVHDNFDYSSHLHLTFSLSIAVLIHASKRLIGFSISDALWLPLVWFTFQSVTILAFSFGHLAHEVPELIKTVIVHYQYITVLDQALTFVLSGMNNDNTGTRMNKWPLQWHPDGWKYKLLEHVAPEFATEHVMLVPGPSDVPSGVSDVEWVTLDGGSTIHICNDKDKMTNLREQHTIVRGIIGGFHGKTTTSLVGDWPQVWFDANGNVHRVILREVRYMPNCSRNIISEPRLRKDGWWPFKEQSYMYQGSFHTSTVKVPTFRNKKGLDFIPYVHDRRDHKVKISKNGYAYVQKQLVAWTDEFSASDVNLAEDPFTTDSVPKKPTDRLTKQSRKTKQTTTEDKHALTHNPLNMPNDLYPISDNALQYTVMGAGQAVIQALGKTNLNCHLGNDLDQEIKKVLKTPEDTNVFVRQSLKTQHVHLQPDRTPWLSSKTSTGLKSKKGKALMEAFKLIKLMTNVQTVGIILPLEFLKFRLAKRALDKVTRKLGFRTHTTPVNSLHYGSVINDQKQVFLLLVKHNLASNRSRWTMSPKRQSADRQTAKQLNAQAWSKVTGVSWDSKQTQETKTRATRPIVLGTTESKKKENILSVEGPLPESVDDQRTLVYHTSDDTIHMLTDVGRSNAYGFIDQTHDGYENAFSVQAFMHSLIKYLDQETKVKVKRYADENLNWTTEEAHVRCGHYSEWFMEKLGLPKLRHSCKECAIGGIRRADKPINRNEPVAEINYRWGVDLVGKFRPKVTTKGVNHYTMIVVDYYTGYCWHREMEYKSESLSKFKEILAQAKSDVDPEHLLGGHITGKFGFMQTPEWKSFCIKHKFNVSFPKHLRSDADSIFKSDSFNKLLEGHTTQEFSSPGDQFFDGKVEHLIGIIKHKMFTVLRASGLLFADYWEHALAWCVYTYNRMPSKSNPDYLTPFHMYTGSPPRIGHLRGFGCECVYWDKPTLTHGSGKEGIFLGYSKKSPTGTYHIKSKQKIDKVYVDSRHVKFMEHQVFPKDLEQGTTSVHGDIELNNAARELSTENKVNGTLDGVKDPKISSSDLHDEERILAPGTRFTSTNGNQKQYITDRLHMLVGSTPSQSIGYKYSNSQNQTTIYKLKDCAYDLKSKRLQLVLASSQAGKAALAFARSLTKKKGTLRSAVDEHIFSIDATEDPEYDNSGRIWLGSSYQPQRDIDGGITVPSTQTLDKDSSVNKDAGTGALSRDEKLRIVKADHLGLVTGVDVQLQGPDDSTITYTLVNDEVSSFVYCPASGLTECVNLVNPDEDVPQTFSKVLKHADRRRWLDSILKEYIGLAEKGTWRIALLPEGRQALGCRLVLKRKVDKEGNITKWKSRAVIQGFAQKAGIDYHRLYQPVAALSTLRAQAAIATHRGESLKSWDFENAFAQSDYNIEDKDFQMFIRYPPGIRPIWARDHKTGRLRKSVLEVKRAQYGAKQSPRCWGIRLHRWMVKQGFRRSSTDSCLYLMDWEARESYTSGSLHDPDIDPNSPIVNQATFDKRCKGPQCDTKVYKQIAVVVYVDDLACRVCLGDAETRARYDKFVADMQAEFIVEDRGDCDSMLGYKIDYDRFAGILKLTQKSCLVKLLDEADLTECRPKYQPCPTGVKPSVKWCLDPDTDEGKIDASYLLDKDYRGRVGSLNWLSRGCRLDISWVTGMLSRHLANPSRKHWDLSTHVLRWLSTTKDRGIVYRRSSSGLMLKGFVDGDWLADYGNHAENRKCVTGYAFTLCGASVSWRSFKQQRVAGSSSESEYYSLWAACRECMHLRRQLKECGYEQMCSTSIAEDNQAVQRMSEDVIDSSKNRHWDKEYHQLRAEFTRGTFKTVFVPTLEQSADILTKSVDKRSLNKHMDILMGLDWTPPCKDEPSELVSVLNH